MSPILVRPVREQLEHDRVIRLLQQDLQKRKVEVGINPGFEQNAGVGPGARKEFPDAVVYSLEKGRKVVAVVEVETGESVNHLEAMAQWAHLAKLRVPFHLYVPLGSVDVARRLSADYNIPVTEIWSYHQVGEQFKFSLIHPPAAGKGRGAAAAPRTVSVSTIRVPLPDPDELVRRAESGPGPVAEPRDAEVAAAPVAKPPRVVPVKAAKSVGKPVAKPVGKAVSKAEPPRPAEKAGRQAARTTPPPAPKPLPRKSGPSSESSGRTAAKTSRRIVPAAKVVTRNAKNAKAAKNGGRNGAKTRPAAARPARVTKAAKSAPAARPARGAARKAAGRRK